MLNLLACLLTGGAAHWQTPDLSKQGMQDYVEQDDPAYWRNFTQYAEGAWACYACMQAGLNTLCLLANFLGHALLACKHRPLWAAVFGYTP